VAYGAKPTFAHEAGDVWVFLRQTQMDIPGSKSLSIHQKDPKGLTGSSFALRVDGMSRCSSVGAWIGCLQSAAKILTLLAQQEGLSLGQRKSRES
jgi:hypothetical protein